MKTARFNLLLPLVLPVLVPLAVQGQVVSGDLFKTRYHDQTLGATPALYFFNATAAVVVTAADDYSAVSLVRPAPLSPVTLTQEGIRWSYADGFGSQAGLDGAFPDGDDYAFNLTGDTQSDVSWTLPLPAGGFWPDGVPAFTAGTRDALLAGPEAGNDFTFEFNGFTDESDPTKDRESLLFFRIFRQNDGTLIYETGAASPALGSATVPASTFSGGESYLAELIFSNRDGFAPAGGEFITSYAAYDHLTQLQFTAVPEPGLPALVIGLGLLGWVAWRRRTAV